MNIKKYDKKGIVSTEALTLGSSFDIEPNMPVLSQYTYVYLSNQRQSTAKSKDRSEVSGGGRKPWKQKGTGRARHGSNRSPIWTKGGVTFGPNGDQNHAKSLPKKVKRLAFRSSVALKATNESLFAMDNPEIKKTSEALKLLKNMNLDNNKVTFVQGNDTNVHVYFRNLDNVNFIRVGELSAYDVLNGGNIVLLADVVEEFNKLGN
jgi:large subunit ribosomal protein L4